MKYHEEMDKFLRGFADHLDKLKHTCCACDCDEEETELDELESSLKKDVEECMTWAFGEGTMSCDKKAAISIWKGLHGDLPIPRYLKMKNYVDSSIAYILLMMDLLPLWVESKKECKKDG